MSSYVYQQDSSVAYNQNPFQYPVTVRKTYATSGHRLIVAQPLPLMPGNEEAKVIMARSFSIDTSYAIVQWIASLLRNLSVKTLTCELMNFLQGDIDRLYVWSLSCKFLF